MFSLFVDFLIFKNTFEFFRDYIPYVATYNAFYKEHKLYLPFHFALFI